MILAETIEDLSEDEFKRLALGYLNTHPKVSWCERINVGGRGKIRFGFKGLSDIIGQLNDGRFMAIELKKIKRLKKSIKRTEATEDQIKFMRKVVAAGGVAGIAVSLEDIDEILLGQNKDELFTINH